MRSAAVKQSAGLSLFRVLTRIAFHLRKVVGERLGQLLLDAADTPWRKLVAPADIRTQSLNPVDEIPGVACRTLRQVGHGHIDWACVSERLTLRLARLTFNTNRDP